MNMNMIQVYIMWVGIITILAFVVERARGHLGCFWEYTLVVALITVGLMLTVEAIQRSSSKERTKIEPPA